MSMWLSILLVLLLVAAIAGPATVGVLRLHRRPTREPRYGWTEWNFR
ncbi:hypothetical protein ACPPVS_10770 [Cellulomonas sp. McL0617]